MYETMKCTRHERSVLMSMPYDNLPMGHTEMPHSIARDDACQYHVLYDDRRARRMCRIKHAGQRGDVFIGKRPCAKCIEPTAVSASLCRHDECYERRMCSLDIVDSTR